MTLRARQVADAAAVGTLARLYRDRPGRLSVWEATGRVSHDSEAALYLQEYAVGGLVIRGIVGALDLSRRTVAAEDRAVLPHEGVHQPQVRQLARRMKQSGLNPAPILLVHHGPERVRRLLQLVAAQPPSVSFGDARHGHHRVWPLHERDLLAQLAAELAEATPVIADGHHRYAAALSLQSKAPGSPWDRSLAMLVDHDWTPLFLGAIHRVWSGIKIAAVESAATPATGFSVVRMSRSDALACLGPAAVLSDGRDWAVLRWNQSEGGVFVEALQTRLMPRLERPVKDVTYHHVVDDALRRTRGRRAVAVLLPALDFDQVRAVVASDRLLPEKATSFQPKPPLGVLMRSLRDE